MYCSLKNMKDIYHEKQYVLHTYVHLKKQGESLKKQEILHTCCLKKYQLECVYHEKTVHTTYLI